MATVINTERLSLEPLGVRHLETVHEYASDPGNTRYMEHLPNETVEETREFLEEVEAQWKSAAPSRYEFAILYEGKQIGAVSLCRNDDLSVELGWIVNRKYWRQGIAYEASAALLEYAAKELKMKHFIAHCDAENTASYKVMEKLGMKRTSVHGGRKNRVSDEERMEFQYELFV